LDYSEKVLNSEIKLLKLSRSREGFDNAFFKFKKLANAFSDNRCPISTQGISNLNHPNRFISGEIIMFTAINDLLFPIFLFSIYFCAACTFIHTSNKNLEVSPQISLETSGINLKTGKNAFHCCQEFTEESLINFPLLKESGKSSINEVLSQAKTQEEQIIIENELLPSLNDQAEVIIKSLNKRQSRQICKPLGIQQKRGKVEKPLALIKAEVHNLFKEDPERVIAVIQEKLPELISMVDQSPYIDEKIAS
jgi:hypothetical protein